MDEAFDRSMPKSVAGAVTGVMADVKRLLRKNRNPVGGYRFASIDDFLAAVNPLCARAGLVILQDELDARLVYESRGSLERPWLWLTFAFTLAHRSGDTYGPLTRSIMVPADGAQAFGAAQSYALKQFLRSLFQIPTGDAEDADHASPAAVPVRVRRGTMGKANGADGPPRSGLVPSAGPPAPPPGSPGAVMQPGAKATPDAPSPTKLEATDDDAARKDAAEPGESEAPDKAKAARGGAGAKPKAKAKRGRAGTAKGPGGPAGDTEAA